MGKEILSVFIAGAISDSLNMQLFSHPVWHSCQSKATDLLRNGLWQKNWRRQQIFCYFCSGNNIKPPRVCGLLFWIYWHHPMQFVIRKKSRANINLSLVFLKGRPVWPMLTHLGFAWCQASEYYVLMSRTVVKDSNGTWAWHQVWHLDLT